MRRVGIPILIVLTVLIVGGVLTVASNQDARLLPSDPKPLEAEASVFQVAPGQRGPLAGIVAASVVVVVGMGIGLTVMVNQLDKAYRRALAEEEQAARIVEEAASVEEDIEEVDIHMPAPSLAPILIAAGATFFLLGVLMTPFFFVGLLVLFFGVAGWALTQEQAIHE